MVNGAESEAPSEAPACTAAMGAGCTARPLHHAACARVLATTAACSGGRGSTATTFPCGCSRHQPAGTIPPPGAYAYGIDVALEVQKEMHHAPLGRPPQLRRARRVLCCCLRIDKFRWEMCENSHVTLS